MVAEASGRSEQHPLLRSIAALEVGDWATALWLGGCDLVDNDSPRPPLLAVALRVTAGGMRDQAAGDLAAAHRQYSDATALLPVWLRRLTDGQWLAALAPEPAGDQSGSAGHATWRAARVIWREQTLLTDLVHRLTDRPSSRDHLIEAYIQFQFEVEFSPFSWSLPAKGTRPYPSVTPARDDLCRRATNLRRLVLPRTKDVSQSVWQDLHGYCGLRTAAQNRLAGRPLAPWTDGASARDLTPLRRGRQRAWEHARQWTGDLAYADSA